MRVVAAAVRVMPLWAACASLLAIAHGAVDLDFGSTDVALAEKPRAVTSVWPTTGTSNGGTRLHVEGYGFATEFFDGSNSVGVGGVTCDVIEGACTVDCGGPRRIVCDTGPWPDVFADSGAVDVVVTGTRGGFACFAGPRGDGRDEADDRSKRPPDFCDAGCCDACEAAAAGIAEIRRSL